MRRHRPFDRDVDKRLDTHTRAHTHVDEMGALVVNSFMSRRGGSDSRRWSGRSDS